ncbi:Trehalose-6-phosphate hydrolase [Schistosoma japonicum]|nr:Trehalose-6-phosphate hydrolase [Schistosoma japonicum]
MTSAVNDVDNVNKQQSSSKKQNAAETNQAMNNSSESSTDKRQELVKKNNHMARIFIIWTAIGTVISGALILAFYYYVFGNEKSSNKVPFWMKGVGYWFDLFAFKDSSGDFIGDFNGLISELDYIQKTIGAGYMILSPIFSGFYSNQHGILGPVVDHEQLDGVAGSMEEFDRLLKQAHEKGLKVVLTIDINSISVDHKWIKEDRVKLMELPSDSDKMISRYGKPLDVTIGDKSYYSVFGHPFVDLDLTNNKTMKEINNVLNLWMKKGVDGFVVENVAFLVEETPTNTKTIDNWFHNCPNSQIFSPRNVDVLKQIRQAIDSYPVNSGDTGCGAGETPDQMLMFSKVVDVTIMQDFTQYRGSKRAEFYRPALEKYFEYNDTDKTKFGLTTATLSMPPYGNIMDLAATLLVPGVPILYYTTELNANRIVIPANLPNVYPFDKTYYGELPNIHSGTNSHFPMPWNNNGSGFSAAITDSSFSKFMQNFRQKDATVEYQLPDENTETPLHLVKQLVSLRKNPVFQLGTIEQIKLDEVKNRPGIISVFTRKAEGFPTFIVILTTNFQEMTLNLTTICPSVIPRLIYPPSKNLPVDKPLPNSEIRLENTDGNFRGYVVSCAA